MQILALNAGSSSLKFALYTEKLEEIERGAIGNLMGGDHRAAVHSVRERIGSRWRGDGVVVHRIVHGGSEFSGPITLDGAARAKLAELDILAPLHLPAARSVIEAASQAFGPDANAIGVFDTALFRTLPPAAREYAVPEAWRTVRGVHRYGFHGFAHQCLRDAALVHGAAPREPLRIVTVQLGRGCSVAAFRGDSPIATSMGFSPLEGLVMPTRAGSVDAAAALYLVAQHGMKPEAVLKALNEASGLLGLSGASAEPAEVLRRASNGDADCQLALDVFFHSLRQYIGAYAGLLGGLDVIALGGGISEHVPQMRRRTLQGAAWLGCEARETDDVPPDAATAILSRPSSRVVALLVRVDEERIMAEQALAFVRERSAPQ